MLGSMLGLGSGAAALGMLPPAKGASVEIWAAGATKTAPFIIKNIALFALLPDAGGRVGGRVRSQCVLLRCRDLPLKGRLPALRAGGVEVTRATASIARQGGRGWVSTYREAVGRGQGGTPLGPVRLSNAGFREVRMQQLGYINKLTSPDPRLQSPRDWWKGFQRPGWRRGSREGRLWQLRER